MKYNLEFNETDLKLMYPDIDNSALKPELDLLDRFLSFSHQILCFSLLGILGVILLYNYILEDPGTIVKLLSASSVISLALATIFNLFHKYTIIDSFRYFIFGLRLLNSTSKIVNKILIEKQLAKRKKILNISLFFKIASLFILGTGMLLFTIAFIINIFS